jgi:hypothetical protein
VPAARHHCPRSPLRLLGRPPSGRPTMRRSRGAAT